ncbi:MAG: metallophosphatase family protein [Treponema sp.]|nr:metallophosphatase family protein [Treponema sp.]
MNKYKQNKSLLIGSKEDIKELAQKDHARLLIISDSHGHTDIMQNIIMNYGKECQALIFCGDGLGDVSQIITLAQEDKALAECLPPVLAFVQGNCDPQAYPMEDGKYLRAPIEQELVVNGQKLLIVHGHAHGVDYGTEKLGLQMKFEDYKAVFYGHTHIACERNIEGYKFVNPGSCSRPRGGQLASFAIATVEKTFIDIAFINTPSFKLWTPLA